MVTKLNNQRSKDEKGVVIFMVAAGLVVFLGIAGLAFDLGRLYNVKTELQNGMDAAAMAGAAELNGATSGINAAVSSAVAATNNYNFNNQPVTVTADDVTFSATRDSGYVTQATAAASPAGIRFVKVTTQKSMDLALIKILPGVGSTQNVGAVAVAGQSPPLNYACDGLSPLAPEPLVGNGGLVTNYQLGQEYTLRFAGGNNPPPTGSGNFLVLDFSPITGGNNGAALVRDLLYGGSSGCIGVGDAICSKPGVNDGPVRQGINDRFDSDTDTRQGIRYSDYVAGYSSGGQTVHGNGRRMLPVPIVSSDSNSLQAILNGRDCPVYIYDIVCFFINDRVSNGNVDVTGEFVGNCSTGGKADPTRSPAGRSGLPSDRKLVLYR